MAQAAAEIGPGIYFGLDETTYHAIPALSCSGMKKLAVSPLHYSHTHFNTTEREEETAAQRFGKAAHCAFLEPASFWDRFARKLTPEDYPGCLVTAEDLKAYLAEQGLPTSGKRKQDLIDRIKTTSPYPTIWDDELGRIAELTLGKIILSKDEVEAIEGLRRMIDDEPYVQALITGGMAEVSFIVRDPESDVLLKARMDYVLPNATVDLKTFSNSRQKPTDKAVFSALYYEAYHLQTRVYHYIRDIARRQLVSGEIQTHGNVTETWLKSFAENANPGFGFIFVESEAPHDLRIVEMREREAVGGAANVYWTAAELQMREMISLYADCMDRYGTSRPWREPQKPRVLTDTDLPQLMFAA